MDIKCYLTSSLTIIPINLQFIGGSNTYGKPHGTCSLVSNPSTSEHFTAVTAGEQKPI